MAKRRLRKLRKKLVDMLASGEVEVVDGMLVLTETGRKTMIEYANGVLNDTFGVLTHGTVE